MKKCPKCNRYMNWYCKYLYGTAYCGWSCVCGFNTGSYTMYTMNRTDNQGEQNESFRSDRSCERRSKNAKK
jgi:hypothetical protein